MAWARHATCESAFRDGKVRTVILPTQDEGRLVCPVQLIILLEVDQGGEDVEDVE
jgi:hypothetical protein